MFSSIVDKLSRQYICLYVRKCLYILVYIKFVCVRVYTCVYIICMYAHASQPCTQVS